MLLNNKLGRMQITQNAKADTQEKELIEFDLQNRLSLWNTEKAEKESDLTLKSYAAKIKIVSQF